MLVEMTSMLMTGASVCKGLVSCHELPKNVRSTYGDSEARGHPVKVVGVVAHGRDLGNDGLTSPLDTKDLGKLLQVVRSGFADREDRIAQPAHAQVRQLFIEELDTELASEERDVLDDRQPDAPLLVLGQLDDGGE
jgi:hypothetical protein